jgi:hypothetical protein
MLKLTIKGLEQSDLYDEFLERNDNALVHYSGAFLRFLSRAIPEVELKYLTAVNGDRILGLMPFALLVNSKLGTVVNSLPFFGSHGGAFMDKDLPDHGKEVVHSLYAAFLAELESCNAVSTTLVENCFAPLSDSFLCRMGFEVVDDRISQITPLPSGNSEIEEKLFASFHGKTRNAIRKGQKSGQTIELCEDSENLAWLQSVHEQSIHSLGGMAKNIGIFQSLVAEFPLGSTSRLYIGRIEDEPVSGLLLLLYGDMVEYFTPVAMPHHREKQVLSDLIFRAMTDLAKEGYRGWNWGGTWRSQEGVYRFKSRWGAVDRSYRYFHRLTDPAFQSHPMDALTQAFPYFYLFKY